MNNLLVKPITEMTPQEIEMMQVQLTQARLSDMQKQLELVANNQVKLDTKMDLTIDKVNSFDVLGMPIYSTQRKALSTAVNRRIFQLLGNTSSDAYILFSKQFNSKLYCDLDRHLGINHNSINMNDWESPNSLYNKALQFCTTWFPSRYYFDLKYTEYANSFYNNTLENKKATAFIRFKTSSNNGASVEFVRGGIR